MNRQIEKERERQREMWRGEESGYRAFYGKACLCIGEGVGVSVE